MLSGSGSRPIALTVGALVLVDQASKLWVQANLRPYSSVDVVPQLFRLSHHTNRGAVGGMGTDSPFTIPMLVMVSALLTIFALWLYRHYTRLVWPSWRIRMFVALTIAPMLSHGIDRLRQGYVVDFLQFAGLPIFNFADVLPQVAVVFLALEFFCYLRWRRRQAPEAMLASVGGAEGL